MWWLAVAIALSAGCSFRGQSIAGDDTTEPIDAPTVDVDGRELDGPPPQGFRLRIEALVDGESHLHIKGSTAHWKHYIFAAPGRWDSDGQSPWTMEPITLNGVEWLPTWPDAPTPENRICNSYPCAGVVSSSTQLSVAVPRVPSTATWNGVQVRRDQGIVQQPSAANDWELIVLISDYMVGGSADYIVEIDVTLD